MQWSEYGPADPLRAAVRGAIEEASGEAISVTDALPDELIAAAELEGISLNLLKVWIYAVKQPARRRSAAQFVRWARAVEEQRREIARAALEAERA